MVGGVPDSKESFWTFERSELLERLWRKGTPVPEIMRELPGTTKGMIIGKAHRLCLPNLHPAPPAPKRMRSEDFEGCRWIEGDPLPLRRGMFCGRPRELGSSYCPYHTLMSKRKS